MISDHLGGHDDNDDHLGGHDDNDDHLGGHDEVEKEVRRTVAQCKQVHHLEMPF